jgi:4-hydroxy-3-polyprenylbenzoate decarboxylase
MAACFAPLWIGLFLMRHSNLSECVTDLETHGELRRLDFEVDPNLELAAIQRRLYQQGSPAILFTRVKGTPFPCLANLYGTQKRVRYLFRHTLDQVQGLFSLAAHPGEALKHPFRSAGLGLHLRHGWPKQVSPRNAPILFGETQLSNLPQVKSWPQDGGAYITLPQVYSEHPETPGWMHSNLGMYRVQISSNSHATDLEAGLHYQIHRGIGVHHEAALRLGLPLRVSIFVGGSPADALAAVMPLPEGIPELAFAGIMAGRRFPYLRRDGYLVSAEADFCILGVLDATRSAPEGPFGDHLGYYSLAHDFPVLRVEKVYHRRNAIWPFTVVGRPPQEDSHFAELIHDLTRESIGMVIPGVRAVHAVEVSGVHPLLLALGSERYAPFMERRPRELLTQAHAILGFGQLSLAKFLWIAAWEDDPQLSVRAIPEFFDHVLRRLRFEEDLHFVTRTTMDTLDYSGHGLNQGSKVMVTVAGKPVRDLSETPPSSLMEALPNDMGQVHIAMPGVVVIQAPPYLDRLSGQASRDRLITSVQEWAANNRVTSREPYLSRDLAENSWLGLRADRRADLSQLPLWILVDDADFCNQSLANLLWVTFTRCDPAPDSDGFFAFTENKHWGCLGPWLLDARSKPHHAPELLPDPDVERRIDILGAPNGPLHGLV